MVKKYKRKKIGIVEAVQITKYFKENDNLWPWWFLSIVVSRGDEELTIVTVDGTKIVKLDFYVVYDDNGEVYVYSPYMFNCKFEEVVV